MELIKVYIMVQNNVIAYKLYEVNVICLQEYASVLPLLKTNPLSQDYQLLDNLQCATK